MRVKIGVIMLYCMFSVVQSHYSGPFLMWGLENLNDMKIPTLQAIDDQNLRDIYTKASAIVIFIRNATTKLNYENFPELSDIIGKNEWLYLPQETLSSDPLEYNVNAEVFTLTGPVMMQDNEIAAFYRDAQISYGNKNVLGILAARNENPEHLVLKREAREVTEPSVTSEASTTPASDEPVENLVYQTDRVLLYTTEPPILNFSRSNSYELKRHAVVSADERGDLLKLIVKFILTDRPVTIKFVFNISAGNWYMRQVELIDSTTTLTMSPIGSAPSAPLNRSFACSQRMVFWNNQTSLTIENFQVQPYLNGTIKFGKAYDCIGFMSPSILSGIFVITILFIALSIALTAILDIKTPNRFENRSSKQLTFTVQE